MNMEVYESQQDEIRRMARRQRLSEAELAEIIEKQKKEINFMYPDQTRQVNSSDTPKLSYSRG